MAQVLVYKAYHERFGGERTYGWLLGTDYTFEISPTSHPDANYIDDDYSVGYAQLGPNAFATQARYDEPDSFINTNRLVVSSGDGFQYYLTDDTGTDLYAPTRLTSFGDEVIFLATSERADTDLAGGEALMVTDGMSAPRLLVDVPVDAFWRVGNEIWARETRYGDNDGDLYRITGDFDVGLAYDWDGSDNSIRTYEVFEIGGDIYLFGEEGSHHEFYKHDADTGSFQNLNIVNYQTTFLGHTSDQFFYWDDREIASEDRGIELWASDGVTAHIVQDIFPGEGSGYPGDDLAALQAVSGDRLFFWARRDASLDYAELFVTDGTASGTLQLTGTGTPHGPVSGFSSYWDIVALDEGRVLFVAEGAEGTELHISDGTREGTRLVADLAPGIEDANPNILEVSGGMAFFTIGYGTDRYRIWVTDGTEVGTYPLDDVRASGKGIRPAMAEVIELDIGNLPGRVFEGTDAPERLSGAITKDLISGLGGDDTAFGNAGGDVLNGGPGSDLLFGEAFDAAYAPALAATVFRLYQATLDRTPDASGLGNWTERLFTGEQSLLQVISGFVNSPEFRATYGSLDNKAFVTLLYQNVLDREPDATGLANWTQRLDDGMSRAEVVLGFSQSPEFVVDTAADARAFTTSSSQAGWGDDVFRLYQATLDRAPDVQGFTNWSGRLADGMELSAVSASFVNSPEFQATYGALDNEAFVTLLYQNVLGREPDATGLANWTQRLDDGMSRAEVVLGFSQSPEFVAGTADDLKGWMRGLDHGTGTLAQDLLLPGTGDNVVAGGLYADEFRFAQADGGSHVVLDLEPWDYVSLQGFGYAGADAALAHMIQSGTDVLFADQGVEITFSNTQLAAVEPDMILT